MALKNFDDKIEQLKIREGARHHGLTIAEYSLINCIQNKERRKKALTKALKEKRLRRSNAAKGSTKRKKEHFQIQPRAVFLMLYKDDVTVLKQILKQHLNSLDNIQSLGDRREAKRHPQRLYNRTSAAKARLERKITLAKTKKGSLEIL
jgi:hypothetical protein